MSSPNGSQKSIGMFSIDIYWFAMSTDANSQAGQGASILKSIPIQYYGTPATADEMARGSHYGQMIDVERSWSNNTNSSNAAGAYGTSGAPAQIPLYGIVENTDGNLTGCATCRLVTPPEMHWAVWSTIIHGARAISYFFQKGNFTKRIYSGQDASIYSQAVADNALITELAPVLNSPFAINYVSVSPHGYVFPTPEENWLNGGIECMAKWYTGGSGLADGAYIFATTRDSESVTNILATFSVADPNAKSVNVIGESRSIPIVAGRFTDTFANASSVHVYQVND